MTISGRTYPVLIQQITDSDENEKKVTTDYTSEDMPPFVLKREIKSVAGDGAAGDHETVVEVLAIDMPYKVLAEVKTSSFVKTLHTRRDGGSSVIIEVHCIEVPGAVVAHSIDELDAAGKVVRAVRLNFSTTVLLCSSLRHLRRTTVGRGTFTVFGDAGLDGAGMAQTDPIPGLHGIAVWDEASRSGGGPAVAEPASRRQRAWRCLGVDRRCAWPDAITCA